MYYSLYIDKVKNNCLIIDNKTKLVFIIPDWKYILNKLELWPWIVLDIQLTLNDVYNILCLQAKMDTKMNSHFSLLLLMIYDIIIKSILTSGIKDLHLLSLILKQSILDTHNLILLQERIKDE